MTDERNPGATEGTKEQDLVFDSLFNGEVGPFKVLVEKSEIEPVESVLQAIVNYRCGNDFDPRKYAQLKTTLEATIANLECKPYFDPFLIAEMSPFDEAYQRERDGLILKSGDTNVRELPETIRHSVQGNLVHAFGEVTVASEDKGAQLTFEVSVMTSGPEFGRGETQKTIIVSQKGEGGEGNTKLIVNLSYASDKRPTASIAYLASGWYEEQLRVDPTIKEKLNGVETSMVSLAMATALLEGANDFIVTGVSKDNGIYDLVFKDIPTGQIRKEDYGKYNPQTQEVVPIGYSYYIDLSKLEKLPPVKIFPKR